MADTEKFSKNIVKVRDDHEPITFCWDSEEKIFIQENKQESKAASTPTKISKVDMRAKIEPWLTSLFQSEHLSLLVGSGLTSAIQFEACGRVNNGMNLEDNFSVFAEEIKQAANNSAKKIGRGEANIEDQIRIVNDLIRGLEILTTDEKRTKYKSQLTKLQKNLTDTLNKFTDNILNIEGSIISLSANREDAFNKLVSFLMSFASRSGTRDRLNIFTTNYDRLIESGADIAGLRLIDRFVGALSPVFRSSRMDVDMHYNPPGIRGEPRYLEGVARFTKLHGSLDWIDTGNDIRRIGLPFGAKSIKPFLESAGFDTNYSSLMIYPNSAKDRETAEYPYVELFRDFAAALCRPNSTLVTYGYSFGDDHINRVIRDMLTIPSTHLVIIAYDDNSGRINKFAEWGRQSQISLMIGREVADINELTAYYLPKPAIDRASMRMAELLRQRFDIQHSEKQSDKSEGAQAQ